MNKPYRIYNTITCDIMPWLFFDTEAEAKQYLAKVPGNTDDYTIVQVCATSEA